MKFFIYFLLRKEHSKFPILKLSCKNSYFPRVMFESVSSNSAINDANTKNCLFISVLRIGALDKLCIFFCQTFLIVILMHWNFLAFSLAYFDALKFTQKKNYVTWKVTVLRHCFFYLIPKSWPYYTIPALLAKVIPAIRLLLVKILF